MSETAQNLKIEFDTTTLTVEHTVGWITLGLLCLVIWAPCWWYDKEIRCALGNQKVCAELKIEPAKVHP